MFFGCIEKPVDSSLFENNPTFKAWEVYTIGSLDVISKQEIKDVTNVIKIKDGQGTKLHQKQVPTDVREDESIYAAFKCNDLDGFYIFKISPGYTRGSARGVIEVDNIGIRNNETGDCQYLDVTYKANMEFNIEIYYSRNPGIRNVWIKNGLGHETQVFNAYPIDMKMAGFDANIDPEITGLYRWKTDSFELKQTLTKEALKVDYGLIFLDKLDSILRYEDNTTKPVMFHWDGTKINESTINRIISDFEANEHDLSVRMWYGSKFIETGAKAPVIIQNIVVFDEGEDMVGTIAIST